MMPTGSRLINFERGRGGKILEESEVPEKVKIPLAFACVFAASAARAAKYFHTEVWARSPNPPGPGPNLCVKISLLLKLLKSECI